MEGTKIQKKLVVENERKYEAKREVEAPNPELKDKLEEIFKTHRE